MESTARQQDEETGVQPGDRIEIPVIVHELYSQPHNVQAVPAFYQDEEIDEAVANVEEKLGYELEKPDDWDEVRKPGEAVKEMAETAKTAGFNPVTGEFMAR
jgi:hypothetical protein